MELTTSPNITLSIHRYRKEVNSYTTDGQPTFWQPFPDRTNFEEGRRLTSHKQIANQHSDNLPLTSLSILREEGQPLTNWWPTSIQTTPMTSPSMLKEGANPSQTDGQPTFWQPPPDITKYMLYVEGRRLTHHKQMTNQHSDNLHDITKYIEGRSQPLTNSWPTNILTTSPLTSLSTCMVYVEGRRPTHHK